MFRSAESKITIDIPTDTPADQEHALVTRKTLKTIQDPRTEKENLTTRLTFKPVEHESKRKKLANKGVQTGEISNITITADDLTSEEASPDYWRVLAEKRGAALDTSFKENEQLHKKVELLEQQVITTNEMLNESRTLIEVLQDIIAESVGEDGHDIDG